MPETFFVLLAGSIMLSAAIPRPTDVTSTGPGEEIQVLGRTRRQTLRQQRPSHSQQKSVAGRQAEEQLRHLQLKLRQATAVRASH